MHIYFREDLNECEITQDMGGMYDYFCWDTSLELQRQDKKKTYALSYQCFSEAVVLSLQARILALDASYFLKNGGHFVISIKVS